MRSEDIEPDMINVRLGARDDRKNIEGRFFCGSSRAKKSIDFGEHDVFRWAIRRSSPLQRYRFRGERAGG